MHFMKQTVRERIIEIVGEVCLDLFSGSPPPIIIEKPRHKGHGDLSTNVALLLAKRAGSSPTQVAERVAGELRRRADFYPGLCRKLEIAGPGFINIFLSPEALQSQLLIILRRGAAYGTLDAGKKEKVQLEFVSANPTGPLTVAHGRQAAVGDSLARVLKKTGRDVSREYYLNDKGRQIQLLGISTRQRYRELFGERIEIPRDGYRGSYIIEIAKKIKERDGEKWIRKKGKDSIDFFESFSVREVMNMILKDLEDFRVCFDHWTSEKEHIESRNIELCLEYLRREGYIYEEGGAVWFRSSSLGDDKDRVLVKSKGERTYFASDIAYHRDTFEKGFDRVIDLWGPDHHGYVTRMRAAIKALGYDENRFSPIIVQLTTLFRGQQKLSMSTREGEFVTLREVIDEVGVDAARYFFVRMRTDSHLNFDLEFAKRRSYDNPVYYVQYVHARICSIFKKLGLKKPSFKLPLWDKVPIELLQEAEELNLIKLLSDFPIAVQRSAETLEPNRICNYLEELAAAFHQCYTKHTVISDDDSMTAARLALAEGVRIVIRIGLLLLGVSAPESM
jgi:arginyl-tRNA synthetase